METIFLIVGTQLCRDRSNYCGQQICGIFEYTKTKINIPVFMVLFWGVRPEWEITWLPFLLPLGVELFLVASSATSAVLTALSLDSSFLESFFSAAYAALLRSSRDLCAGDFFDDDLDLDDDSFSSVDLLDEDFSR